MSFSELWRHYAWWVCATVVLQGRSWMTWRSCWRDAPAASAPPAPPAPPSPCLSLKRPRWKPRPSQWPLSRVCTLTHMHHMHRHLVSLPKIYGLQWPQLCASHVLHYICRVTELEVSGFWKETLCEPRRLTTCTSVTTISWQARLHLEHESQKNPHFLDFCLCVFSLLQVRLHLALVWDQAGFTPLIHQACMIPVWDQGTSILV